MAENAEGSGGYIVGTVPAFAQVTEKDDEKIGQGSHGPG